MSAPNCPACVHCSFSPYQRGWSEYTPSSPMNLSCDRGRWDMGYDGDTPRDVLEKAEGCPDFKPEEWAKEKP